MTTHPTFEDFPFIKELVFPGRGGACGICGDCGSLIPIPEYGYEDYPEDLTWVQIHEGVCPGRTSIRTRVQMEHYDEETALASIMQSMNNLAPGQEWTSVEEVTCVQCPRCGFTMDEIHVNDDGSGYTCPDCGYH